ncbi:hypothetical protein BH10PLA2_BH10PLA2_34710 [soil metagenome]
MEPLQTKLVDTCLKRRPGLLARLVAGGSLGLASLATLPGCIPEAFVAQEQPGEVCTGIPCKIATRWDHDVHFPPDTKSGNPLPTIAGRVTLFASDLATPVLAEGTIIVYMYDDMPDAVNKEEPLEAWILDTKTVHKLQKKDAAGWGFTLILPWQRYRPDLTHVKLKVRFDRVKGTDPLYSELIPITFESATGKPRVTVTSQQIGMYNGATGKLTLQGANGQTVVSQPNPQQMNVSVPAGQDASNGGSLPTSISLSPPANTGSKIPFVLPPPGAVR